MQLAIDIITSPRSVEDMGEMYPLVGGVDRDIIIVAIIFNSPAVVAEGPVGKVKVRTGQSAKLIGSSAVERAGVDPGGDGPWGIASQAQDRGDLTGVGVTADSVKVQDILIGQTRGLYQARQWTIQNTNTAANAIRIAVRIGYSLRNGDLKGQNN